MSAKRCFVRLRVQRELPMSVEGISYGTFPDYRDVHIELVAEDGTVLECPDIRGIALDWKDGDREPLEVTLRVMPGEVDIDVLANVEADAASAPSEEVGS